MTRSFRFSASGGSGGGSGPHAGETATFIYGDPDAEHIDAALLLQQQDADDAAARNTEEDMTTMTTTTPRLPPSNDKAEMALLGALLTNNLAVRRVSGFLRQEHFADAVHGRIYAAIVRRVEAGQVADVVTIKVEFEHSGGLDEVGGSSYVRQLVTRSLVARSPDIDVRECARSIRDCWIRRQLIDIGEDIHVLAHWVVGAGFGEMQQGAAGHEIADKLLEQLGLKVLDRITAFGPPVTAENDFRASPYPNEPAALNTEVDRLIDAIEATFGRLGSMHGDAFRQELNRAGFQRIPF